MIIRNRKRPQSLQKLDALISRLSETHPKMASLRQQAAREQKGFNGEKKLDYYVTRLPEDYYILHDVCFTHEGHRTQIDSVIVSTHAIYLIEIKSYHGEVTFNTNLQQFIRGEDEQLQGFKYPLTQVEHMKVQVQTVLQENNVSGLPIHYFIAFAESSTVFRVIGDEEMIGRFVTYVDDIPLRIMNLDHHLKEIQPNTGDKQLRNRITTTLMQRCEEFTMDTLAQFDIDQKEILRGIHCEACEKLSIKRINRKWKCSNCGNTSKTAHIKALQDYLHLIGPETTNQKLRHFLQIESRHIIKKLLLKTDFMEMKTNRTWIIHPIK